MGALIGAAVAIFIMHFFWQPWGLVSAQAEKQSLEAQLRDQDKMQDRYTQLEKSYTNAITQIGRLESERWNLMLEEQMKADPNNCFTMTLDTYSSEPRKSYYPCPPKPAVKKTKKHKTDALKLNGGSSV